ncbi:hypothetical protein Tco_0920930 [Tanacetum coccineum]
METSDPVDTPMVEKSKLDADPPGKDVDPTRYRGMIGSHMYLHPTLITLVAKIPEDVHLELADIFTKALGRERLDFLINKIGMRSMSPETLKSLAEEDDK